MLASLKPLIKGFLAFRNDLSGNIGMIFAFALLPAIGLIGLADDFATGIMAKRRLDAAADAAVLHAVSKSSNPNLDQTTQDAGRASFDAQLGNASNITVVSVSLTSGYVDGNLQVTLKYRATVPTNFGSLFQVPTLFLSGSAVAVAPIPAYANFYLLLDNSPSMGIGATVDDITQLQSLTGGCAFACHEHTSSSGRITGDNTSDNYHIAKNNNVVTRIDVERIAAQHLFDSATANQQYPNQYNAAIYTFSDVLQTIATLSSNLSDVASQAQNIDLAYSYFDHRDTQTSYDTAFSYMSNIITQSGNGLTSSSPISYLFVVTDGVQDEPVGTGSGSNNKPDKWVSPSTQTSPPGTASPNLSNTLTGNFNSNSHRLISTFSSGSSIALSQCQSMKAQGIKIAILYTTYLPINNDNTYKSYVAPISSKIPTDLQGCASPNLFFTVTPSQGIDDAMKAMFKAATSGLPRLTQ
ncbi:pilus assembly protein TadG-related protein [Lichenifustis flavocetrariae]|uniref:Pilus assembly protein TadG-related protein n=1 Tax=Lichenifustis flavocetrariae TaxID=2949735 RepID=A0AA42CKA0_9HYPH|nr:pilus assembly protein TadG-related protein [Lichenifustis flavocetrariae]MCW6510339.1 pilus assembly protein TadG-related protein [Lichenifustis flavocetrariae]